LGDYSHEILVVNLYPSGSEEWLCPTCGRRFVVQWTPEYQCTVLNVGDENAIHNLSRGALVVASAADHANDDRLVPWIQWLRRIDLNRWLDEETALD
jgi:hypothetical protein